MSDEFHQVKSPMTFQGRAEALSQLFDPNADAPYPVDQYPHLNSEFVCWLQLPSDVKGTEWYFGCVTFKRNRFRKALFSEFLDVAAKAGACLRQNPVFREWLWPCLQYLSQADRHPKLLDGADVAWWVALLFTKPDILKPLHSACTRSDIQELVRFEIDNPASWSRRAISSRQLDSEPVWPKVNCRVATPFRDIPCPALPEEPPQVLPDYLDLIVNRDRNEVTRRGTKYAHIKSIRLSGEVEWPLFIALFAAAGSELTKAELHRLPGEVGKARREAKRRLNEKLIPLDVTIPHGEWRLTQA